ncbi:S-layer homology domain-containing protein [Lysinibacillus xylanilyticus]|uniref:S-layer homology domain-containing protein n=1 Tax=Lysinibacillus xylanilyticus TaxID=582475 RepID=UPI002B24333C|nr:S-layer homology domain-containing protein [Lysinibacillus xylanilyticus]MEB2298042.1 S-layer homology domain-containing protein [Lysinibacillus xylanilyticus]
MKKSSKKKMFNVAMATAVASGAIVASSPAIADAAAVKFKDVPANSVHAEAISNLAERGIINGFPDGTFGPNKTVTRGQAAKIIAGVLELDTKNVKNPNFKDVKTTDPFYGAIAALKAEGIINGNADGTYGLNNPLTRGQMAKIIVEAFDLEGETTTPFTDVPENNIYAKYIKVLYGNNVTTGTTPITYMPNGIVTRGELASFVVRAESIETSETTTVTAKITEVKAGQVVTSKGTFKIAPSVSKIFNEANAAALKNADAEFIVENGKITGVKSLTLNAENTTFNAGGVSIPKLVVDAAKVTISDVKADTLQINKDGVTVDGATITKEINIGKNITVTLKNVKAPVVNLGEGSKLTLDTKTVIDVLNLPANTKLENVITNFAELKDKIKDIIKNAVVGGNTTGGGGNTGGTGGGTGGGNGNTTNLDGTIDSVIEKLISKFDDQYSYVAVEQDKTNNVLKFEIVDPSVTLSKVKSDMAAFDAGNSIAGIITDPSLEGIGFAYDKLVSITEGSNTYTKAQLLDKDFTKKVIMNFVDANQGSAKTIGELAGKSTIVTVNFGSSYSAVAYELKIVNEK